MKSNKTKNKSKIDIYNPVIYPIQLMVVKGVSYKQLEKKLNNIEEECLPGKYDAVTSDRIATKDGTNVVLVALGDTILKADRYRQIETCSHEATHVATDILTYLGCDLYYKNQEPYAYLVGWATKCIYKTLVSK